MKNGKCIDCKYSELYCNVGLILSPDCTDCHYFEHCTPPIERKEPSKTNHAEHYSFGSIECIDAIKACMSKEEYQGFLKGNVFKYLWRYKLKGGADDLDKASVYLAWLRESYGEGWKNDGQ